jgi:hypothetical protein
MYDKLYNNIDAKVTKTWHTHPNEEFRMSHKLLNGITCDSDEQFSLSTEFNGKMRFPTDILSSEGDNCSCWLTYEVER